MRTQRVTEMLEDAGRRAGEAAYERSQNIYHGGQDLAATFAHSAEEYVSHQPIRTVLMTVGIVCLITSVFIHR